jgi:hypothetical protein
VCRVRQTLSSLFSTGAFVCFPSLPTSFAFAHEVHVEQNFSFDVDSWLEPWLVEPKRH